jgi:hypothetical protein
MSNAEVRRNFLVVVVLRMDLANHRVQLQLLTALWLESIADRGSSYNRVCSKRRGCGASSSARQGHELCRCQHGLQMSARVQYIWSAPLS